MIGLLLCDHVIMLSCCCVAVTHGFHPRSTLETQAPRGWDLSPNRYRHGMDGTLQPSDRLQTRAAARATALPWSNLPPAGSNKDVDVEKQREIMNRMMGPSRCDWCGAVLRLLKLAVRCGIAIFFALRVVRPRSCARDCCNDIMLCCAVTAWELNVVTWSKALEIGILCANGVAGAGLIFDSVVESDSGLLLRFLVYTDTRRFCLLTNSLAYCCRYPHMAFRLDVPFLCADVDSF